MNHYDTAKLQSGIIKPMIEAGLDPMEFKTFMDKYAPFIELGILSKKILVVDSPEFGDLNTWKALTAGTKCLESFVIDFFEEYKREALNLKPKKKKRK